MTEILFFGGTFFLFAGAWDHSCDTLTNSPNDSGMSKQRLAKSEKEKRTYKT